MVKAEVEDLAPNAKSAIMIEASTGEILFQKNKDEKLAPASMTKMMSMILIMEEIENGNLKWDEMITTSERASSMGGSQIFLKAGEKMSVEDLLKGVAIASGNDAVVALAERIAGSEEAFVKRMNARGKDLGLKNTNFVNATGLTADNHYSSAYDMSLIAKELVKHEKILEFDEVEDKIKYTSDIVTGITGLKEFSKYLTLTLELDALTLDDDRHFNNIAVIFDGIDYYLPPLFDFGASFLSDTMIDYPLSSDLDKLLEIKNAKPFSSDFNEQVDVAESLYGTQLKVHTTANEVCSYVDSIGYYSQEIKTRVKTLIRYAFRKYRYLLGSNGMKNLK